MLLTSEMIFKKNFDILLRNYGIMITAS